MSEKTTQVYGEAKSKELTELSSSFLLFFVGIGDLIGFYISPVLIYATDYRTSFEILAYFILTLTTFYVLFGGGY